MDVGYTDISTQIRETSAMPVIRPQLSLRRISKFPIAIPASDISLDFPSRSAHH
jgi:hypothetical protein